MPGHPWIGHYLFQLYLALVLLDSGGLEADQLAWWRQGLLVSTTYPKATPPQTIVNEKVQMPPIPTWTGSSDPYRNPPLPLKYFQKRDLLLSSDSSDWIENNAQTMSTTKEDLNQPNQTVNYKACLSHKADSSSECSTLARPAAKLICSLSPNLRISRLLFHSSFPSRCWSPSLDCPPSILSPIQIHNLLSNISQLCENAASDVLCEINSVNAQIERVEHVLESGYCMTSSRTNYTQQYQSCDLLEENPGISTRCKNCKQCKMLVVSWICMSMWPLWLVGHAIRPCPGVCSLIQEYCPFHVILEDPSAAGGDPTFLCEDPVISENRNMLSSPQCCSVPVNMSESWSADHPPGELLDPPAGGYVDLNASHCSALLTNTTPFCDKSLIRLSLANQTLTLRQVPVQYVETSFLDKILAELFTAESGSHHHVQSQFLLLVCILCTMRVYTIPGS